MQVVSFFIFFFFFSSRRRHTRCSRDWSSDVCSSDLHAKTALDRFLSIAYLSASRRSNGRGTTTLFPGNSGRSQDTEVTRSEERRVGKECRSRRSRYH